ncbi:helix-turn-helix transcriptional regulator [Listeria monocytogenes]|nr:helix-turn-helix transcriptional regulator [Listeria monocytogenes]EJH4973621.1 helix-turn-helix transcriptional regulator [Listeria monocytogenes]EJH5282771.1 helix-turn-helix transcriptional regulator [Listeria monocytogenes]EJH6973984.1 helix-turn-helix transcriptional regulator [Listeria monocytogenes]HAK9905296.1 helix-turn-helix transcriptional regulator [Listeria monocytogenes]
MELTHPYSKNNLGITINYFRKKDNLTLKELGKKVGKTDATVSRWITGERIPRIEDIYKLVEIFDTTFDTLMCSNNLNSSRKNDNIRSLLTNAETTLINNYRNASVQNKAKILAYSSGINDSE